MDRKFDTDNFERLLREKSDEFKMYPSKRVWHSIYNNLHPGRKWPSVAMCITLIASLLLVGYLNTGSSRQDFYNSQNQDKALNIQQLVFSATPIKSVEENIIKQNWKTIAIEKTTIKINPDLDKQLQSKNPLSASLYKESNTHKKIVIASTKTITVQSNPGAVSNTTNISAFVVKADNDADEKIMLNTNNYSAPSPAEKESNDATPIVPLTRNNIENDFSNESSLVKENIKTNEVEIVQNPLNKNEAVSTQLSENVADNDNTNDLNNINSAQKNWIENYALYNRAAPKKWAGKLAWHAYITPSVVYRKLYANNTGGTVRNNNISLPAINSDVNADVEHKPFLGLEIGAGLKYDVLKGVRANIGIQLNYTSYTVHAFENSHPISSSLTLINSKTHLPYEVYRSTPYSNKYGLTSVNLFNETFQLSIPIGADLKLAGNENIQWYAGASIQPTVLLGGKSYLISSDRLSYVKDASFLNRFNMNAGFETFVTYKVNGLTWQIGPQFRTQLFGTNNKSYSVEEKLVNYGFKIGLTKNL